MRRILFDHLAKCAGSTINNYLKSQYDQGFQFSTWGRGPMADVNRFKRMSRKQREHYRCITGHDTYKIRNYVHGDTIQITLLRDPVDRVLSYYFYMKNTDEDNRGHEVCNRASLFEMLKWGSGYFRNYYVRHFTGWPVDVCEDNPVAAVQKAMKNMKCFHMVGFYEDLERFGKRLQVLGDFETPFPIHRMDNKTTARPAPEEISSELRSWIIRRNWLDVRLYRNMIASHEMPYDERYDSV